MFAEAQQHTGSPPPPHAQRVPRNPRYVWSTKVYTQRTKAQMLDLHDDDPDHSHLDDDALKGKLKELESMWAINEDARDPSTSESPLSIQDDTLDEVMQFLGVSKKASKKFLMTSMPVVSSYMLYSDDDTADSMIILFRFPRMSNSVIGVVRVQIATRNSFAFVCSKRASAGQSIRQSIIDNAGLVRATHPFYLLALVLERRFEHWSEPFIAVWRRVVELETATSMTHPGWRTHDVDPAQVRFLANTDNLLRSLHSTHVELCHSRTVMSLGIKFGAFCIARLDELEAGREARGLPRLSSRETSGLKDLFRDTVERCESTKERFSELSDRLAGQMNVSYNLIAQNDSKINFAIAKLQARDSQTVKAIAVLTLSFLPTTLLATLWTTNLWELKGSANWLVFLILSILLTAFVFAAWMALLTQRLWKEIRQAPWTGYPSNFKEKHIV
ncbi:hypothetical protein N3K66_000342 [Trichothecium roseum]|uniref:Uncharacterized protein n=1 Tax=Trichothecium roseum TaxID=47278 RepID=A0ACC0VDG3_9HYPO|nr:hypothetical protein N3K66_000342 [Trichothecium roseum]